MTEILVSILGVFIIYVGAYAAALATASSFFAAFFFFWTRTGERKNKVDLQTKQLYLPVIYATLRISLYVVIIAFLAELITVYFFANTATNSLSLVDLLLSVNVFFTGIVLLILLLNSTLMIMRKMPFAIGLPLAIVSYFVLFVAEQFTASYYGLDGFFLPAFPRVWMAFALYAATFAIGYVVFNHYSRKVRNNLKK